MYIILLKFSKHKDLAQQWMSAHQQWIQAGMDEKMFLLVGSLEGNLGGIIFAQADSYDTLQHKIDQDPFVIERVVTAEVIEFSLKKAQPHLQFFLQ